MKYIWLLLCCSAPVFVFSQVLNDSCHQAKALFCGDVLWVDLNGAGSFTPEYFDNCDLGASEPGVWYKIVGTGELIHLSSCNDYSLNIQVFEGNCDTLICLYPIANFPNYQCDPIEHKEVAFRSEAGKTYYIYCRSKSALTFGRLSVACYAPLPNDICSLAKPIVPDSTYVYDHRFGNPSDHNSCFNSFYRTLPDSWYTFQGIGGYVQVDNFSENLLPSCLIKEACNSLEFVESDFISGDRAYFTEVDVTYFLQIASSNVNEASFRLRTFHQAGNDECTGARPFPLKETFTLTFDSTLASVKACTVNEGTYDRWYYFTGNDSIVTFSWNPYTSFTGTRIKVLTGTCASLVCETLTQANNEVSVPTIAGKHYWVNIHNSNAYEFDTPVNVNSVVTAPLINDEYTGAIPLQCGDTIQSTLAYALEDEAINGYRNVRSIWYKVIGTGEFTSVTTRNAYRTLSFEKKFFTMQDGDLVPAPINSHTYTYLAKDSTYFLNIIASSGSLYKDFEILLACYPVDEHDICESALPVSVTDTTYGKMGFTYKNTFDNCSSYGTKPDVWYQFTGDGRLKDLVFENVFNDQTFALLKGTCDSLNCITSWFNYFEEQSTSKRVLLEEGVQFFLKVQARKDNYSERKFNFNFRDLGVAANDLCHNAQLVSCGDTIRGTLDYAARCDYGDPCQNKNERRVWYELIGQGDFIQLSKTGYANNENTFGIEIYAGDCCERPEIDRVYTDQNNKYFKAEAGKKYLIAVQTAVTGYDGRFDLSVQCIEFGNFKIPENSTDLPNNQEISSEQSVFPVVAKHNILPADCPEESLACRDTIELSEPHLFSHIFDAGRILVSNATVEPQIKVLFRAGERVSFFPGFHAKVGSEVHALIQDCSSSAVSDSATVYWPDSKLEEKEAPRLPPLKVLVFPNPLSQTATVRFYLPATGYANLSLHDMRGTKLKQFLNEHADKGWNTSVLDGSNLPNGKYLISLHTPFGVYSKSIVVVK